MITLLMLLSAQVSDDVARFTLPPNRLAAACGTDACRAMPTDDAFRVPRDSAREVTSKDRAIRADGSYCSVVGAKRCTGHGRTIFTTDFSQ